jgi:hypothetical protein
VADVDTERDRLTGQLTKLQAELDRLAEGLAKTGGSPSIAVAIARREEQQAALQAELD